VKTIKEINRRIKKGEAVIVRADEMPCLFEENPKRAVKEVDIVTTATFGAMCSSGVFLNFGHSDPPIKMSKVWLNEVEAYTGLGAVDAYLGAAQLSEDRGIEYGGAHVIEDLVSGEEVSLRAEAYGTDCYPRKSVETSLRIDDLNQAILFNPRNCYQRYNAAINSTDSILHTYMGTLLPNGRNVNFSGTGEINPLNNDPEYETIGIGTRIFLGGSQGYVTGEGTQHSPKNRFGTLSLRGNLKEMDRRFLKGATIPGYGVSLFVGIGVPIPILNERIAENTAVRNRNIKISILDYGIPRLERPVVKETNYEELFSGSVEIDGRKVRTSPLSSLKVSFEIMDLLKEWIEDKEFFLSEAVEPLPKDTELKPMRLSEKTIFVENVMTKNVITVGPKDSIRRVAELLVEKGLDQVPVVDSKNRLVGIVTSWDITKATAQHKKRLRDIMTKRVISSRRNDLLDVVARRLDRYGINSTPVIDDEHRVIGIITLGDINRALRKRAK